MKALMYVGNQSFEVMDVPKPQGQFIIKVLGCNICGTDLKTFLYGHPFFKPPTILGHEFWGIVEKAPEETGYKPGDYVVAAPYGECGECSYCKSGSGEMCKNKNYVETGAFCEYVEVPIPLVEKGVIKLDNPDKAYSLAEPLACVLLALEQLNIKKDNKVLIIGGGPMGTLFALTLMDMGMNVSVSEINEKRRENLTSWGIPAQAPDVYNYKDFDRIVVAVNKKEIVEESVQNIADCGIVHVFAGLPSGTKVLLDAYALHYRKVTVLGSTGFSLKHFHKAFEMIKGNPQHYAKLITHTFRFEDAEKAFRMLQAGEAFKIMIKP